MNNRYFTLLILFLGTIVLTSADAVVDEYKVIKVNGEILYKNSGKEMSTGDVFKSNSPLIFKSDDARAAVISRLKGRFVLAPPSKSQTTNLVPAVNNISSRSGALVNQLDLKNHFDGKYLVLKRLELPISEQNFPQDEDHFFFLSYEYEDEKIAKKLSNDGNKLIIDERELFTIDETPIEPYNTTMTLFYRNAESKENITISTFEPIFPDYDLLEKEVNVILEEYKDKEEEKQFNEVKGYLTEFYGKPYNDNLKDWLSQID